MATDNTTTLLSGVTCSGGKIKFNINIPKGYTAYYQVLPATAKAIGSTASIISVDYDTQSGKYTNSTTSSVTKAFTITPKLYGKYIIKVGLGGYYGGNSSLRQSATVTSRCNVTRKLTKSWTSSLKTKYENKETISLSDMASGMIAGSCTIILKAAGVSLGGYIDLGLFIYNTFAGVYDELLTVMKSAPADGYVGFYLAENSAATGIDVKFAAFNSSKSVLSSYKVGTLYYSNYIPTI